MDTNRLKKLERKVTELYRAETPGHDDWSPWLIENHVIVVADYASTLAERYDANVELARAAALLHDIADIVMARVNVKHEAESMRIARELLQKCGYKESEINLIVEDAIAYHSCHDGRVPSSPEGKILATADAMAHLKTDFYLFACWSFGKNRTFETYKEWALKKLERDFHDKIFFDAVKTETEHDYETLKKLVSR